MANLMRTSTSKTPAQKNDKREFNWSVCVRLFFDFDFDFCKMVSYHRAQNSSVERPYSFFQNRLFKEFLKVKVVFCFKKVEIFQLLVISYHLSCLLSEKS
jgi:hypothetical protein